MITTEVFSDRVEMRAFGELTLAECKHVEEQMDYRVRFNGAIDMLMDYRGMANCSIDVVMEELRYARAHSHDFRRVAVITDDQWVTWVSWLTQFFIDGDLRVFDSERDARQWLASAESDEADAMESTDQAVQQDLRLH